MSVPPTSAGLRFLLGSAPGSELTSTQVDGAWKVEILGL